MSGAVMMVIMKLAGPPPKDVEVPGPIRRLGAGQPLTPVWQNMLGGLTFQLGVGPERRFAKWAPADSGLDLSAEVERLRWAVVFTPVPEVYTTSSPSTLAPSPGPSPTG
jgi:kanamycin kinase